MLLTTNATEPPQFRRDLNRANAVKKPMPHLSAMEPAEAAQVDGRLMPARPVRSAASRRRIVSGGACLLGSRVLLALCVLGPLVASLIFGLFSLGTYESVFRGGK